jgi:hypothetical protein
MKPRFRITPQGAGHEPSDSELLRYRDSGKLWYNYQRGRDLLHRKPLYKDPKAFVALLLIVLLAWLISEGVLDGRKDADPAPPAHGAP